MDVLEEREANLRAKVLGASPCGHPPLIDRLRGLQHQLDQLLATVSGSLKLRELYQEHVGQLQLPSLNTLTSNSFGPSEELLRASILSSTDRLHAISAQLQQMEQLTCVLDQLRAPEASSQMQLTRIEAQSEWQRERVLAFHLRVEKVLAMYQQMIRVLSEKCVEYHALLDQLQV